MVEASVANIRVRQLFTLAVRGGPGFEGDSCSQSPSEITVRNHHQKSGIFFDLGGLPNNVDLLPPS